MCIFVCLTLFCHHKAFANISWWKKPSWPLMSHHGLWMSGWKQQLHTQTFFLLSSTVALVRQQHSDLVFALAVWHWEQNIAQRNEPIGGCHLAFGMVLAHCLYGPQLGQSGLQAKDLDMLDGKCNFPFAGVMAFCKNDGISTWNLPTPGQYGNSGTLCLKARLVQKRCHGLLVLLGGRLRFPHVANFGK